MNQEAFPILKGQNIILDRLQTSDWKAISYLRSEAEINKYLSRSSAPDKESALAFIHKMELGFAKKQMFYWAIRLMGEHEMLGSICLWNFSENRKKAELGYDLMPAHQGKGLMQNALNLVQDFASSKLGIEVLEAYTHHANAKSVDLLKRNDFTLKAEARDPGHPNNRVYQKVLDISIPEGQ